MMNSLIRLKKLFILQKIETTSIFLAFTLATCSGGKPSGLEINRKETQSPTLYVYEIKFNDGGKTYEGPEISGIMLKVKNTDLNNDGVNDIHVVSKTYPDREAKILITPNAANKFDVFYANKIGITYSPQGLKAGP